MLDDALLIIVSAKHTGPDAIIESPKYRAYLSELGNSFSSNKTAMTGPQGNHLMVINIAGKDYQYSLEGVRYRFRPRGLPPPIMNGYEQDGDPFTQKPIERICKHRTERCTKSSCCGTRNIPHCSLFTKDLSGECNVCTSYVSLE